MNSGVCPIGETPAWEYSVFIMTPNEQPADPLFDFELKIARRADELLRGEGAVVGSDAREIWYRAEAEVLETASASRGAELFAAAPGK